MLPPTALFPYFANPIANGKKYTGLKMCVSSFSTTFVRCTCHSNKIFHWLHLWWEQKHMLVHTQHVCYSCKSLIKTSEYNSAISNSRKCVQWFSCRWMDIYSYAKTTKCNIASFMVKVKNPIGYCCIFIQHGKKGPEPMPMGWKINI